MPPRATRALGAAFVLAAAFAQQTAVADPVGAAAPASSAPEPLPDPPPGDQAESFFALLPGAPPGSSSPNQAPSSSKDTDRELQSPEHPLLAQKKPAEGESNRIHRVASNDAAMLSNVVSPAVTLARAATLPPLARQSTDQQAPAVSVTPGAGIAAQGANVTGEAQLATRKSDLAKSPGQHRRQALFWLAVAATGLVGVPLAFFAAFHQRRRSRSETANVAQCHLQAGGRKARYGP